MPPYRSPARSWTDLTGRSWQLFIDDDARFAPGKLLVFTSDPKDGLDSPKVLVRGLVDVWSMPEPCLGFYLAAARAGGFVWRDRDGAPWHISTTTRVRCENGRSLELRVAESHRPLWALSDDELERMVGQSTSG